MQQVRLFGLTFDDIGLEESAATIVDVALKNQKKSIITPNVEHVLLARDDAKLREVFNGFDYHFVDSMPLVWMSKCICKVPLTERIAGVDLFQKLCECSAAKGVRVYLLGATDQVLKSVKEKLKNEYPEISIVGIYSPPIGFDQDDSEKANIINQIDKSDTDLVFCAFGTPKQELWISNNINQLPEAIYVGIGGAFDIYSGKYPRAPVLIQNLGCEWLWRLSLEPRRLWRRYLKNFKIIPCFFLAILNRGCNYLKSRF